MTTQVPDRMIPSPKDLCQELRLGKLKEMAKEVRLDQVQVPMTTAIRQKEQLKSRLGVLTAATSQMDKLQALVPMNY